MNINVIERKGLCESNIDIRLEPDQWTGPTGLNRSNQAVFCPKVASN